jgi:hypothetical protein
MRPAEAGPSIVALQPLVLMICLCGPTAETLMGTVHFLGIRFCPIPAQMAQMFAHQFLGFFETPLWQLMLSLEAPRGAPYPI